MVIDGCTANVVNGPFMHTVQVFAWGAWKDPCKIIWLFLRSSFIYVTSQYLKNKGIANIVLSL